MSLAIAIHYWNFSVCSKLYLKRKFCLVKITRVRRKVSRMLSISWRRHEIISRHSFHLIYFVRCEAKRFKIIHPIKSKNMLWTSQITPKNQQKYQEYFPRKIKLKTSMKQNAYKNCSDRSASGKEKWIFDDSQNQRRNSSGNFYQKISLDNIDLLNKPLGKKHQQNVEIRTEMPRRILSEHQ